MAMVIGVQASLIPKVVRRFSSLSAAKRRLAVEATLALLLARLLTRFVPARRCLAHSRGESARLGTSVSPLPAQIGRAVAKVARHLPFHAKCLPQALAAQWMLRRRGVQAALVLGVRRNDSPERTLDFHAWLMFGRDVVIGGHEVETYSAFPKLTAQNAKHP